LFRRGAGESADAEHVRDLLLASEDGGASTTGDAASRLQTSGKSRLGAIRDIMQLPFVIGQGAFWMNQKVFLWLLASPLIALSWRARRYLADSTAVQLTRYPDGLARGLIRLSTLGEVTIGDSWSSHLFVIGPKAARNPIDSLVSFDPPLGRRLAHLVAAGATIALLPPRAQTSPKLLLIAGVILVPLVTLLVAALFAAALALVYVALAIYMLFLFPMIGLLHLLLHRLLPQWLSAVR
jgi:hypothetical protein